jgi:ketosteroid isomerase-like protein
VSSLPLVARLLVRVPGLAGLVAALLVRLQPGTPLRRWLLSHLVVLGFRLNERQDYEHVARLMYESDTELWLHGYDAMGLPDRYTGRAGVVAFLDDWQREVGLSTWRPEEVIDLGDRVLVRVQFTGTGRTSGAALTHTSGWLFHLSPRGRIAVHDFYWEWQDVPEAVRRR